MTNQMLSLAELIAPVDLGTFWGEYWEQQTLHVKRDKPHHYDHIFALRDLDTLLAYHNAPGVPLYSVANRSPLVPQMSPPTARDAFDTYYQGNTLFIASVHQRWQPIAEMCRQTEDVLRHPVGATMVLSPKGAQGLSVHHDAADVFVLQLEGEKDWQVYTPTYPLPLEGAGLQEAALEGVPSQIVRLRAGDMMYVPRGFPHKAFTSEQMSLHLSMYVNVIRWKDFLSQVLLQVSEEHVEFRQGLPVGFLASGQQIETVEQELYRRLELLREHTHVEAAIQRMTANFIQQMLPLPDGQFVQVDRLDAITLDTTMTKRAGMICQVSGNSTSAEIRFPGSMVNGPAYLEPALRFIAETETFSVAELPGNMSDKSRVVLVRRLVREGLLRTLERPA